MRKLLTRSAARLGLFLLFSFSCWGSVVAEQHRLLSSCDIANPAQATPSPVGRSWPFCHCRCCRLLRKQQSNTPSSCLLCTVRITVESGFSQHHGSPKQDTRQSAVILGGLLYLFAVIIECIRCMHMGSSCNTEVGEKLLYWRSSSAVAALSRAASKSFAAICAGSHCADQVGRGPFSLPALLTMSRGPRNSVLCTYTMRLFRWRCVSHIATMKLVVSMGVYRVLLAPCCRWRVNFTSALCIDGGAKLKYDHSNEGCKGVFRKMLTKGTNRIYIYIY